LLTEAYQLLKDPVKRKEYDRQFEVNPAGPLPIFLGKEFADGIDSEALIRIGVLCLLYSKRRANPDYAALSLLDMENIMAFPRERLLFALWYLRAKRFVLQDDRSSFIISAEGVDYLEAQLPTNKILYKIFHDTESGVMVFPKALTSKTT
jgi:curved DNA-binding protein CbpA